MRCSNRGSPARFPARLLPLSPLPPRGRAAAAAAAALGTSPCCRKQTCHPLENFLQNKQTSSLCFALLRSFWMFDSRQLLLHEAAASGNVTLLEAAITAGVNVNHERGGATALCRACRMGHAECVKRLLVAGADLTLRAAVPQVPADLEPLHLATVGDSEGHTECVAALLQAGADPWATIGTDGAVALHMAAGRASVEAVRLLCEAAQTRVSLLLGWLPSSCFWLLTCPVQGRNSTPTFLAAGSPFCQWPARRKPAGGMPAGESPGHQAAGYGAPAPAHGDCPLHGFRSALGTAARWCSADVAQCSWRRSGAALPCSGGAVPADA